MAILTPFILPMRFPERLVAREIGNSQPMMACYESPPANLLPAMATVLGISVDALLGMETSKRRAKASDTRLQRRMLEIEKMDVRQKRQIMQVLDTFIENEKHEPHVQAANHR